MLIARLLLVLLLSSPLLAQAGETWWIECVNGDARVAVSADGLRQLPLARAPEGAPSPDGSLRLATRRFDRDTDVVVIDKAGTPRRLASHPARDLHPLWTPAGRVIFSSHRGGVPQLYRVDADGQNLTQLTRREGGVTQPLLSADGKQLVAFGLGAGAKRRSKLPARDVIAVELASGRERVLRRQIQVLELALSADGDRLAVSLPGRLELVRLADGKTQASFAWPKTLGADYHAHAASRLRWRPDGKAIAFNCSFLGGRMSGTVISGDHEVIILPLDGGKPVKVTLAHAAPWGGRRAALPDRWSKREGQ